MHLKSTPWMELVILCGYSRMKLHIKSKQFEEVANLMAVLANMRSMATLLGKNSYLELSTGYETHARVEFEFNEKVNIRKILIINSQTPYFKSIEAFVGDRSQIGTGDYSSFTSLGIQSTSPIGNVYYKAEYKLEKPVSGTFLAFRSTETSKNFIRISEIRVFQ